MAKKTTRKRIQRQKKSAPPAGNIVGEGKTVPIDMVKPNKFNYNKQSAFIFEKMLKSLTEFGFVDPLECRSGNESGEFGYYEIIGGEHRFKAAEQLGYTQIPIIDLGCIPDAQAKKLCIVLNETKGRPDNDALSALIASLNDEIGMEGLEVLPFDDSEIEAFIGMGDDWDDQTPLDLGVGTDPGAELAPKKETLVSLLGLLDISATKERALITRFKSCLTVMGLTDRPVRALEKMMRLAQKRYERLKAKEEAGE